MINQLPAGQLAANSTKTDLKSGSKTESKEKLSPKEALTQALKQNLGLSKGVTSEELLEKFTQSQVGERLKELVNKLLLQINAHKNPESPILKQGNHLNFAPNFANELKTLSVELGKSDIFNEVLARLEQILKPASEIKTNNLAPLLKNSGVFFEAKLKDALNEELLPKSFHKLLNTIKSLSNEKISSQISTLATLDLGPEETLKELKNIIDENRNASKELLKNSNFKSLLELSAKVENFKNYINKNPNTAQNKILQIAGKIFKEIQFLKDNFFRALAKPENLTLKDPNILKQVAQSFEKLENTLKHILDPKQVSTQSLEQKELKNPVLKTPQEISDKKNENKDFEKTSEKLDKNIEAEEKQSLKTEEKNLKENSEKSKENPIEEKELKAKENLDKSNEDKESKSTQNKENPGKTKESQENLEKIGEKKEEPKNLKSESKERPDKIQENKEKLNKTSESKENLGKSAEKNQENSKAFQNSSSLNASNPSKELIKQGFKNLAFNTENGALEELEKLSKDLVALSRKINEALKQLDPRSQNAKTDLNELKILENKLNASTKDLQNIKIKTDQDIVGEIRHDVKSALLQVSSLAKNEGNEAVYNQANRLLAQIEINQLMSLANDSIHTYLPFFWDDLNDSKVMFRRGKKDKFFAQIKLEFAKLGNLEIFISLNNEKYIDINIMAENQNFRKTIYENAHELKRSINKAGLLSANFFVGDLIRSKFDLRNIRNYDLEMGMDKKV